MIKKVGFGVLLFVLIVVGGCRKCYYCYSYYAGTLCHLGTDSVFFYTNSPTELKSKTDGYISSGFTCQILSQGWPSIDGNSRPEDLCGKSNSIYKEAIKNGDSCAIVN